MGQVQRRRCHASHQREAPRTVYSAVMLSIQYDMASICIEYQATHTHACVHRHALYVVSVIYLRAVDDLQAVATIDDSLATILKPYESNGNIIRMRHAASRYYRW